MSIPPPRSPGECFATLLRCLGHAVVAMMGGERLSGPVIAHIVTRIREIKQRFARLTACLAAGTYKPRRYRGRKAAAPGPRRRSPVPQQFGWLLPLVPDAVCYRSQLSQLLGDPAMVALIQAAPAPMARVLRPLCWMLRLEPPPILARPRPQPPPRPPTSAKSAPRPKPPLPPPAQPPEWLRAMPRSAHWPGPRPTRRPPPRACGPPQKA